VASLEGETLQIRLFRLEWYEAVEAGSRKAKGLVQLEDKSGSLN